MTALGRIEAGGTRYTIRRAAADDVGAIVALIAADQIGATRDGGELTPYERAFAAIDEARRRGAALVQLTSDARREEAHRFYGRLGFVPSHTGFKLPLR